MERLDDGSVLKSPRPDEKRSYTDIKIEARIYELLRQHDQLVSMLRHFSKGLNLEYIENKNIREYLREHKEVLIE